MINVTKAYLPSFEKYVGYLRKIWDSAWLTNNGPLVVELESRLKEYLDVKHCFYCSNGTVALQIALRACNVKGDVLTTPFTYVATSDAIVWEGSNPIFVDITDTDFNLDAGLLENTVTKNTKAIMGVHVYGNPMNVDAVTQFAQDHNLKVIYDAAHAFGVKYKGRSLLSYGDVSTCSLHATKLFHSCEGGLIITNDDAIAKSIHLLRQFGHIGDDYYQVGINGKNSELHAAMGLCVLDDLDYIIDSRKEVCLWYDEYLQMEKIQKPQPLPGTEVNFAYYPIILPSEHTLLGIKEKLQHNDIIPRRYFYPSLNTLPFFPERGCPNSENYAKRVLSLPLFPGLEKSTVIRIAEVINNELNTSNH